MKRVSIFITLALAIAAQAGVRTVEDAAVIAASFSTHHATNQRNASPAVTVAPTTLQPVLTQYKKESTDPAYYIFNRPYKQGFVLVSGDDVTDEVLLYSDQGEFDPETANPSLKFWLNRLQEQISYVNEHNVIRRAQVITTPIEPLLGDIAWDQLEPYNRLCPLDSNDYTLSYTGCVATAASQIMRYWRYPAQTNGGEESYTWICYDASGGSSGSWWDDWWGNSGEEEVLFTKELSLDYDTIAPYNWDLMLPTYDADHYTDEQANEVARLMYHAGIATHMGYGGVARGGSGSYTDDMADGLVKHFGYKYTVFLDSYRNHRLDTSDFKTAFDSDLEKGRPILMGGIDGQGGGGHEFVCDGRDAYGAYHINWGWSGEGNCYTYISVLQPDGEYYQFNNYIDAVIGLEPEHIDTIHVEALSLEPTELTLRLTERAPLTATIYPSDATFKTVFYSSDDESIATVTNKGVVRGIAPGETIIRAVSKEGNKTAECTVTVLDETMPFAYCEDFAYEFAKEDIPKTGVNTLDNYTWNIARKAGSFNWDNNAGRGLQLGSKTNPAQEVLFNTTDPENCQVESITVTACQALNGDAMLSVLIDGEQIGETVGLGNLTQDYVFENTTGMRGEIEIKFVNSKRAMFVKAINMTFHVPSAVEEVNDSRKSKDPCAQSQKILQNGQLFIRRDGKIYNALGIRIQ